MLARAIITAFVLGYAAALPAQSLDAQMRDIGARLADATQALKSDAPNMAELNAIADELEGVLRDMRQVERDVSGELEIIEDEFYAESENLMQMIGFIATFESQPAPDYILHPDGPVASVQANIIVASLMENLEGQVGKVAGRLQEWREFKTNEDELATAARMAFDNVNTVREELVRRARGEAPALDLEDVQMVEAVKVVSENMDQFARGLDRLATAGSAQPAFSLSAQNGEIELPVAGRAMTYREGVQIFTDDYFVEAPMAGTVRFASKFLDYGEMVILEPEPDVLVVLAGFDAGAVALGDVVQKGDIIGFFNEGQAQDNIDESDGLRLPKNTLYVETRVNTEAVNVMDYFREKQN